MTAPAPIDAAVMNAIDVAFDAALRHMNRTGEGIGPTMNAAIRAAAPILIAAGREAAAVDIEAQADDEVMRLGRDGASRLIEEWLREAARIARGGAA